MATLSPRRREALVLAATILASGMAFLDGSVVNIAVPVIQSQMQASLASMLWVVNAFMLVVACLLMASGGIADHFGRRRVFCAGIALFTGASFLCGLAGSTTALIIFRALQGLGAAAMIPGSLAIINTTVDEARRGRAIGLWSGFSGGIAALGPFVGGWLIQTISWRAVFFINLPLGAVALALSLYAITESKSDGARLDWPGILLISGGLLGVSYGLMSAPDHGWGSPHTLVSLIAGVVLLACFFLVEARAREPLVPLRLFRSPLVAGANLATLCLYFALSSLIFFLVLNLQQVQGLTPLQAGLALLPSIIIITFFSGYGGSLADRTGPRAPMTIGALIVAAGMSLMLLPGTAANYWTGFFPGLVLFGAGMSLVIAPLTKSALSVPQRFSGAASGVNNAVSRVASLLAVAVIGAVAIPVFAATLQARLADAPLTGPQRDVVMSQAAKFGAIKAPVSFDPAAAAATQQAVKESFVHSFRVVMSINVLLALAAAVISLFYIKKEAPAD